MRVETPDKGTWAVDGTLYRGREWKSVENRSATPIVPTDTLLYYIYPIHIELRAETTESWILQTLQIQENISTIV